MPTVADNFCIRTDYTSRSVSTTLEDESNVGSYWTPERLESSLSYQYDVYRLAYQMASKRVGPVRLLDVGCGPARKHVDFIDQFSDVRVSLVDQPSVARLAKDYLPAVSFYPLDLETSEASLGCQFDIVLCADVIEHLVNPDRCVEFICRHTHQDGIVIISTPERNRLYGRKMRESGHPHHVREWSRGEFLKYLESRGLQVDRHRIVHQKQTGAVARMLDPVLDRLGIHRRSFSCQLAICTVGSRIQ